MDYVQGSSRDQILLFPEAIDDFISPENPVRFIEAFVDSLTLPESGFTPLPSTGRPPYNPADQELKFRSMLNERGRLTRYYVTPA